MMLRMVKRIYNRTELSRSIHSSKVNLNFIRTDHHHNFGIVPDLFNPDILILREQGKCSFPQNETVNGFERSLNSWTEIILFKIYCDKV